jgi:ribosomal protein L21E
MKESFSVGTRVRISVGERIEQGSYSHLQWYEGMTGEVVSSMQTVGYVVTGWREDSNAPVQPIQAYRVHLDAGVEIGFVTGDCLKKENSS